MPEDNVLDPEANLDWEDAKALVNERLEKLLGVSEDKVSLFHNTTVGVQRILTRILQLSRQQEIVFLTTDFEYPGIMAMADECWPGPLYIVKVEEMIWNKQADQVSEAIKQAILLTRPTVVYLSHVSRGVGYVLKQDVVDFIRAVSPGTIIILDGAQAIGNIDVSSHIIDMTDFYVTSGHKWLGGQATLGVVLADPAALADSTRTLGVGRTAPAVFAASHADTAAIAVLVAVGTIVPTAHTG